MSKKLQTLLELGEELTILYVEDSEMVRESTCDLLEEYFDNIDIAVNGEEGLVKYREFYEREGKPYDVVITDINMPKMSGIEMLESIFRLSSKANVIVMSAHNEPEYLLKLINMGISNFILKPIELTKFQNVVSNTIQILFELIFEMNTTNQFHTQQ